jgi:aryl-alcohol dehydrogenase-like predicted oxidoreductase
MKYRNLGRTGLKVSAICLGTMTYGEQVEEAESIKLIETAIDGGINFFDTSNAYVQGRSEEVVGKALKKKRDQVIIATKVSLPIGQGVNDRGLSRYHIIREVENSLKRLGTDYIDLYYAHMPDHETAMEETLRAMDDLVRQGKVRYIGCSNFHAWRLCKALWISDVRNLDRFNCIQSPYNLLTRDIEYELVPLCASEGVGITAYNPLAAGLLTGKHDPEKGPAEGTRFALAKGYYMRYWSDINFEAVTAIGEVAKKKGVSMAQFALAWIMNNRTLTAPICSATSVKQLEENLGATEVEVTEEDTKACDKVWQKIRPPRYFYGR